MLDLPELSLMSVKIPVQDLAVSRRWYADVFGLSEEMEWPDRDGVVRGVAFSRLGGVVLALREDPDAAAATRHFGFLNIRVPTEADLTPCAAHLDHLGVPHTPVIPAATGRLVGFHDLDGHELSFYAETLANGVREVAVRRVRAAASPASGPASRAVGS